MLKQRIITAFFLLILVGGLLFFASANLWFGFTLVLSLLITWEYARLHGLHAARMNVYLCITAALGLGLHLSHVVFPAWIWLVVVLFWLLVVPLWLYRGWQLRHPVWVWLIGWLLVLPFWRAMVVLRPTPEAALSLLALMALVWIADTGAYFVGRRFGRHKLAPKISPGKSREGALGALVAVSIYVFLIKQYTSLWPDISLGYALIFGVGLTVISIVGDLFESSLKRAAGVKDSSQLLPGHGGVFDRMDSMIAVLAVTLAVWRLWVYL